MRFVAVRASVALCATVVRTVQTVRALANEARQHGAETFSRYLVTTRSKHTVFRWYAWRRCGARRECTSTHFLQILVVAIASGAGQ